MEENKKSKLKVTFDLIKGIDKQYDSPYFRFALYIFIFSVLLKQFNIFTFGIPYILLGIYIYKINEKNILSGNFMFYIFYTLFIAMGVFISLPPISNAFESYNYNIYIWILGGLILNVIGNIIAKIMLKNKKIKRKDDTIGNRFGIKRIWILRILFLISILAAAIYFNKNMAIRASANIENNRIDAMSGQGKFIYLSIMPIILIPVMLNLVKKKQMSKIEFGIYLIISLSTLLVTGFRAFLMLMLSTVLYLVLQSIKMKKGKISILKLAILGILMVGFVFGLGVIRANASGNNKDINEKIQNSLTVNIRNLRHIHIFFPSKVPFQKGYTYLINILMLRPGPDDDFTIWLKKKMQMKFDGGGVTPTIIGEFYINFGELGVIIGMIAYGILGNLLTVYNYKHIDSFLGSYWIIEYAHAVTGGIGNVTINLIYFTTIYWFLMLGNETEKEKRKKELNETS